MASITLGFYSEPNLELVETQFSHHLLGGNLSAVRGASPYGGHKNLFRWSPAIKALSILLLRTVLFGQRQGDPGSIRGARGSLASSLDYAISKETSSLLDIFGVDAGGRALVKKLIQRTNPERKRSGDVVLFVNPQQLKPEEIIVLVDGAVVDNDLKLESMISLLSEESVPAGGVGVQPINSKGVRTDKRILDEGVLIHFDSFREMLRCTLIDEIYLVLRRTQIFNRRWLSLATKHIAEDLNCRAHHRPAEKSLQAFSRRMNPSYILGVADEEWLGSKLKRNEPIRILAPGLDPVPEMFTVQ